MALKSFRTGLTVFPSEHPYSNNGLLGNIIDATGEAAAAYWRSPINGKITAFNLRFGPITTGDTISAEVQTIVTSTELPSDTLFAVGAASAFSLTTTMANTWQTIPIGTLTVSTGDVMALVIKRADTGGAGNFQVGAVSAANVAMGRIYQKALAWTATGGRVGLIYPTYSGTTVPVAPQTFPYTSSVTVLSAGAATDEVGNIFQLPFAARAAGCLVSYSGSAGALAKITLYNSNGTSIMATAQINGEVPGRQHMLYFNSPTVLAVNTQYRVSIRLSAGAGSVFRLSAPSTAAIDTLELGSLCYATSRADLGAWSEDTTARFSIGILVDQLDDSAASGGAAGGLAHIIGGGL